MKKTVIIAAILSVLLMITYFVFNNTKSNEDPRGSAYAGASTCIKCHSDLYGSYLHTAHFIASGPGSLNTVHGSFAPGSNTFVLDSTSKIVMEKRDSGLYQSYYLRGKLKESRRFDIAFGAIKGETYLYWKGNELYQLPMSYFTAEHKWSTSPGYKTNLANFTRPIDSKCLSCHASYIAEATGQVERSSLKQQFDKNSMVYGVDCERCHGPAAQHVEFQTEHPEVKTAKFIVAYSSLPRARKMDMCGTCHSGRPDLMLRASFGFKPGDTLANYKVPDFGTSIVDESHLDVHGNQLQLLQSSKCYLNSTMTCTTCHDVHQNQRGNEAIFTQKCLACHSISNHNYCKMAPQLSDAVIKAKCIQCHMPALPTQVIKVQTADRKPNNPFLVHTHHIAIYPDEVKKILAFVQH